MGRIRSHASHVPIGSPVQISVPSAPSITDMEMWHKRTGDLNLESAETNVCIVLATPLRAGFFTFDVAQGLNDGGLVCRID